MKRRDVLVGLGCAAGGGYVAKTYDVDVTTVSLGDSGNSSDPMESSFSSLSGAFEKMEWSDDGKFEVTIAEDNNMDGFGVRHEYVGSEDYDGYTLFREVQQFGGTVSVDFKSELDTTYPSRSFSLVGLKGNINDTMPYIKDRTVSVSFTVPSDAVSDDHFQ